MTEANGEVPGDREPSGAEENQDLLDSLKADGGDADETPCSMEVAHAHA